MQFFITIKAHIFNQVIRGLEQPFFFFFFLQDLIVWKIVVFFWQGGGGRVLRTVKYEGCLSEIESGRFSKKNLYYLSSELTQQRKIKCQENQKKKKKKTFFKEIWEQ